MDQGFSDLLIFPTPPQTNTHFLLILIRNGRVALKHAPLQMMKTTYSCVAMMKEVIGPLIFGRLKPFTAVVKILANAKILGGNQT
jgi:hypothetical protein